MTADPGLIDAHVHLWNLAARPQPWLELPGHEPLLRDYTVADLAPLTTAAGVAAAVVVQTVAEPGETPGLLAIAAAAGPVAAVVGWIDLTAPDPAGAIAELRSSPGGEFLRGIRHPVLIEPDPDWLRRPDVHRGLTAVGSAGLAYDVVVPPDVLAAATDAAAACPGLVFVLDHLGNPDVDGRRPDELWLTDLRAFAALPNTVCKLSGILGVPPPPGHHGVGHLVPYFGAALEEFGPDRLMFGSDWPPCTLSASYADVLSAALTLTADLSQIERAAIFGGTARRVYGLPG